MIYLLRHLQKEHGVFNPDEESYTDYTRRLPLTAVGRKNAQLVAERLQGMLIKKTKIITSDFRRAYETAEIISAYLGIDIESSPLLVERCLAKGNFKEGDIEKFNEISLQSWTWAAPGGESMYAVAQRMRRAIKNAKNEEEDLIVVSHSRSLQAYLATVKNTAISKVFQSSDVGFIIRYGEIITLDDSDL